MRKWFVVDQVGHAVLHHQPVTGREVDAHLPLFLAHHAAYLGDRHSHVVVLAHVLIHFFTMESFITMSFSSGFRTFPVSVRGMSAWGRMKMSVGTL
jgi:hypothetical protein